MATKQELRHYAKENGVSLAEAREHFINLAIKKVNDIEDLKHIDKEFFKQMKARGGYDPVIAEYIEVPYGRQAKCYWNAEQYVKENGGEVIYGWGILPRSNNIHQHHYDRIGIVELHQHAIVKQGDKYIDVTPYAENTVRGAIGGDETSNFKRWFWRDDMMDPQNIQLDCTIWIPNTAEGHSYRNSQFDLGHILPGELGLLDPSIYGNYTSQAVPVNSYEEAKKYQTFKKFEKMGFMVYDLSA